MQFFNHVSMNYLVLGTITSLAIGLVADSAAAFQEKRNISIRADKTEVVYRFALLNARFPKEMEKCQAFRPPSIVVTRKPQFGTLRIRKGVKYDSPKNSECKGNKVLGTIVEFTSAKRGKTSFKIDVLYRQSGYYDHKFGDVTFNVTVR